MSRPPDCINRVSERLSEVMGDIGVNDRLVMKRRRAWMLIENITTLGACDDGFKCYHFGSQSEGSTTLGLESDIDALVFRNITNVIQNMSGWKLGELNLMMIQTENISPGYCHLQSIFNDLLVWVTANDTNSNAFKNCVTDCKGRLLVKNTSYMSSVKSMFLGSLQFNYLHPKIHGPAITMTGKLIAFGSDLVTCFSSEAPHYVTSWLQTQRECKFPTECVLKDCRKASCFVVAVGGKDSDEPELEWRISTSLQERYLMFSLNITQLRCYVLMKMILKTHIEQHVKDVLTSFMCKNVLWYCIANSSHDWHTGNLLSNLHLCLFMLKECVEQRNCPHFIIKENNLLAGRMTDTQRGKLLHIINNLMKNGEQFLYEIQIDDLGTRLKMRLNMISDSQAIDCATDIAQDISGLSLLATANSLSISLNNILNEIKHEHLEIALSYLSQTLSKLERDQSKGDSYKYTASNLFIPLVKSTVGSLLASANIETHTEQAFTYLEAGKESDALSGRLKLVSVLYCTGAMKRTHSELRIIETQYNISELHTLCSNIFTILNTHLEFTKDCNEEAIKSHVALCTRFLQCEINCVPHELRYELLRSYIIEDRQILSYNESVWMDMIVVDSIPYLYFLLYKTYGHLQRRTEQLQALFNLTQSIYLDTNLGHKETALNLLGQCMEHENRQTEAFQYYIRSLKHRARNNAARFLLCIQMFKLWK